MMEVAVGLIRVNGQIRVELVNMLGSREITLNNLYKDAHSMTRHSMQSTYTIPYMSGFSEI